MKIVQEICHKHGVTVNDVLSRRRDKKTLAARFECYKALRGMGLSFPKIGKIMNRDHSTVCHFFREL